MGTEISSSRCPLPPPPLLPPQRATIPLTSWVVYKRHGHCDQELTVQHPKSQIHHCRELGGDLRG